MLCLSHVLLDAVTASSAVLIPVHTNPSSHTLSWSVKPLGTQVSVTCACGGKCTWVFKSPATAALWGLRFLTEPIAAAHGATISAKWILWWPSSGIELRLRVEPNLEPNETLILSTNGLESTPPEDDVEYRPDLPF